VSIDKARGIVAFFTGLKLSKSQADSLLSQLAMDWQIEYDAIAELIACAAILYIDETGWKVGKRSCYTGESVTIPDSNDLPPLRGNSG
jgi:hypothetical protein